MIDDLPIVDAHQHFWDPPRTPHPWLTGAPLASFRYGDYAPLRRPYLPADFRADANGDVKLLEVNPNPGWCWDGKLNLMAEFADYRYPDLLRMIIETAQARVVNSREAAGMGDAALRAGRVEQVAAHA